MCGIIALNYCEDLTGYLEEDKLKTIEERGDQGIKITDIHDNTFAHSRLPTIGEEIITHPISNENHNIHVLHNGNIYNHQAHRNYLVNKKGHNFSTDCDSEVIVHLYEEYGIPECFKYLEGTFAGIIYDEKSDRMIGFRDPLGYKPLYFSKRNVLDYRDDWIFSSTIHSILELRIDNPHYNSLIQDQIEKFRFPLDDQMTLFQNVYTVPPGSYVISDNPLDAKRYTDISFKERGKMIPTSGRLFRILTNNVEKRLETEQPLVVTLSGGIDSCSILTALNEIDKINMNDINTVNIRFPGYDESEEAQQIAEHFNTNHRTVELKERDLPIERMIKQYGSFIDRKGLMSELAVNYAIDKYDLGVTILNGNLSDELFGGYSRVEEDNWKSLISNHICKSEEVNYNDPYIQESPDDLHLARLYFDLRKETPRYNFRKQDACGSMFALDVRNPYYSIDMIRFAKSLHREHCYKEGKRKWILRNMLKNCDIPKDFYNRKKKYFEYPEWQNVDWKEKFIEFYFQL